MDLNGIRKLSVYELARLAGCGSPPGPDSSGVDSAGGSFLGSVRDAFVEAMEYGRFESEYASDVAYGVARGAADPRTYVLWQEFVDLEAWQEEPESGEWPKDPTEMAGVALFQVANMLVLRLRDEVAGGDEDDDERCPCGRSHTRAEHGYSGE